MNRDLLVAPLHGATFRKSSYSEPNESCVEVAVAGLAVGVCDSKNAGIGLLTLTAAEWSAFVGAVKGDELVP